MKTNWRLAIVVVWLVLQMSVTNTNQQLFSIRPEVLPPGIFKQNSTCCQVEQSLIDKYKQRDDVWVMMSRRQNITCYGGRVLFPYGPECADFELSKDMTRSPSIDLGYNLKFMGHRFNKAWVNQHGFISFQESFLG